MNLIEFKRFNVGTKKLHFLKYMKFFLGCIFFIFLGLGLEVHQIALNNATMIFLEGNT